MKRVLRAVLGWLDRKFPDKIVVTPEKYQELVNLRSVHDRQMQELHSRVKLVEENISRLNVNMGFTIPKPTSVLER